jgi:hypothetical protein
MIACHVHLKKIQLIRSVVCMMSLYVILYVTHHPPYLSLSLALSLPLIRIPSHTHKTITHTHTHTNKTKKNTKTSFLWLPLMIVLIPKQVVKLGGDVGKGYKQTTTIQKHKTKTHSSKNKNNRYQKKTKKIQISM